MNYKKKKYIKTKNLEICGHKQITTWNNRNELHGSGLQQFFGPTFFYTPFLLLLSYFFYQKYERILSNNYEFNANINSLIQNMFSLFVLERHIKNDTCLPSKAFLSRNKRK